MNYIIIAAISALSFLWLSTPAETAWIVNQERFHFSVHGRLSCQDCHEDISEKIRHPDPAEVNKALMDFFHPARCLACHQEIGAEIAQGSHADKKASSLQRLDYCIECHDPHYQIDEGQRPILLDPNQSAEVKCSLCHDLQSKLPEFPDKDRQCLQCHLAVPGDDLEAARKIANLCFHCHSSDSSRQGVQTETHPLIDTAQYASTPHMDVSCLSCHPRAAEFDHKNQPRGDCRQCHLPHDEKVAHDAHRGVTCGACHLRDVTPVKDSASGKIGWRKSGNQNRISTVHRMQMPDKDESCRVCHRKGNSIGAAAMVLPAKSMLCMPCHAATLSVGDPVTLLSVILFIAGMLAVGSVWFAGGDQSLRTGRKLLKALGAVISSAFSIRAYAIAKSLLLDGFLQMRLLRASKKRWIWHALIFYPIFFRFVWGISGLVASLRFPGWSATWLLLDKNYPLTAFLFDFSGTMVIIGVIGMMIGRMRKRSAERLSGLPPVDWLAYALLGGIILGGFILEGMRIAMTGSPSGASYAFVGDAISRLLAGIELTGVYGYVWYLHAILTGVFLAYLPFSRMFHMIIAPIGLAINAASDSRHPAG